MDEYHGRPRLHLDPLSYALRLLDRVSPPGIVHAHDVTAVYDQNAFRGYLDDNANVNSQTAIAAVNTNWSQDVDTTFMIRFECEETAGASPAVAKDEQLQYNLEGAGWNNVTSSSSVVRMAAGLPADNAATGDVISASGLTYNNGGTSTNGCYDESVGRTNTLNGISNGQWEDVFSIQIRSADVSNGQTIQLRVVRGDTGAAFNTYTNTPTITVVAAVTPEQKFWFRTMHVPGMRYPVRGLHIGRTWFKRLVPAWQ